MKMPKKAVATKQPSVKFLIERSNGLLKRVEDLKNQLAKSEQERKFLLRLKDEFARRSGLDQMALGKIVAAVKEEFE